MFQTKRFAPWLAVTRPCGAARPRRVPPSAAIAASLENVRIMPPFGSAIEIVTGLFGFSRR